MADKPNLPAKHSSPQQIDAFLDSAARVPALSQAKGRMIFAIDATMSRQPTWDRAVEIQSDMFEVAHAIGGLAVQLVLFRGAGEFITSEWATTPSALAGRMRAVTTRSGFTQMGKVLRHAVKEAKVTRVGALVYVGDCFEEAPDSVMAEAGKLALLGVPAFVFHEGDEPVAAQAFQEIARLTNGAYARFDQGAAEQLRALLKAAAVYATGGAVALREYGEETGGEVLQLSRRMGRKR